MLRKTSTDLFWDSRSKKQTDPKRVNIDDLVQRELEADFIIKHLKASDEILEVGCGNGFFTSFLRKHVKHVDAFDYSENMIKQAKEIYGQKNNTFFHDNLLQPTNISRSYDVVVCTRVLINLESFEQQKIAFNNLLSWVRPCGKLLILEGFIEGFNALNAIRKASKIPELHPATINYYSSLTEFVDLFPKGVSIVDVMHTGSFDFLTRVIYPALVGSENSTGPGEFHEKILNVVKIYNPDCMKSFARLWGWALLKK